MSAEIERVEDVPAGRLLIGGTFAIYTAGGGGLVMVTDVAGRGVEKRTIPRAVVAAFQGRGPLGKMAARMFGGAPPLGTETHEPHEPNEDDAR